MDERTAFKPSVERYAALMDVVRNRLTSRAFRPDVAVPREHVEMVLEAARHAPPAPMPSRGITSSSPTRR